jgi:hypothetical protein
MKINCINKKIKELLFMFFFLLQKSLFMIQRFEVHGEIRSSVKQMILDGLFIFAIETTKSKVN